MTGKTTKVCLFDCCLVSKFVCLERKKRTKVTRHLTSNELLLGANDFAYIELSTCFAFNYEDKKGLRKTKKRKNEAKKVSRNNLFSSFCIPFFSLYFLPLSFLFLLCVSIFLICIFYSIPPFFWICEKTTKKYKHKKKEEKGTTKGLSERKE